MKRTSVYLEDEELKLLKHLAVEEEASLAELVRRAVRWYLAMSASHVYLAPQALSDKEWNRRLDKLLASIRARVPSVPPEEIEAEITKARGSVEGGQSLNLDV
jgi:hypothetical protein